MKILATSKGITNAEIENKLMQMIDKDMSNVTACIVVTASLKKCNSSSAIYTKELFTRIGFKSYDFIDIEFDNPEVLNNYDVIYFNGGDPFYLLLQMQKTNATDIIKKLASDGRIIIGNSAGSMILADSIEYVKYLNEIAGYDTTYADELIDYKALGLIKFKIVTHYNKLIEYNENFENELSKLEKQKNISITRLNDEQAIAVDNGNITFI